MINVLLGWKERTTLSHTIRIDAIVFLNGHLRWRDLDQSAATAVHCSNTFVKRSVNGAVNSHTRAGRLTEPVTATPNTAGEPPPCRRFTVQVTITAAETTAVGQAKVATFLRPSTLSGRAGEVLYGPRRWWFIRPIIDRRTAGA